MLSARTSAVTEFQRPASRREINFRNNCYLRVGKNATICGQVRSDNEQVGRSALGVGSGEFDLLAEVVALVAGCHDGDCALLDLYINLVAFEVAVQVIICGVTKTVSKGVCFNTDGELLCLGI